MDDKKLDDNRPASAHEVLEQHEAAKALYGAAIQKANEVQELLEGDYNIPRDVADSGNIQVSQVVQGRAILEKFRQTIQIDKIEFSVMPLASGDKEKALVTRLERALRGIDMRLKWEMRNDYDRDAAWWYLFRGQAMYETIFKPEYKGTDKFPIRIYAPDPNTVFPVKGKDSLLYYTKEYKVYGRELCKELDGGGYQTAWLTAEEGYKDCEICCVEYWDDTYHALVCKHEDGAESDGELIYSKKHDYKFVPLSIGYCMDTPLASAEWAYSSVIAPVVDSLKQVYMLMSKISTGVNMYYYPLIVYISADNRPVIWNPMTNTGEDLVHIQPGSQLIVLNPTPNAQIINQAMAFHAGDIALMTLPEIAFGKESKSLESGFAYSQVLSAAKGAIDDKLPQLQMAAAGCRSHMLRLIDKFSKGSGLDFSVPMNYEA